jgi:hypothetical protein
MIGHGFRLSALVALAFVTLTTPVAAQWRYEETATEARAQVFGANGTSIGLRCTTTEAGRDQIYLDLLVIPVDPQPDPEEVAEFTIGTWTFNIETIPQRRVGNLYRYQSRFSYYDPVIENMRRQMMGGSVLRFTRSFDFAEMSFTLSGSRAAIGALEAACPRLWARGARPTPPAPPVAAGPAPAPSAPALSFSNVPAEAIDGLREYVRSVVAPQCGGARPVTLPPDMFRPAGNRVTVLMGQADCDWQVRVNPYCGAQLCQAWVYSWDGGSFTLVENSLR